MRIAKKIIKWVLIILAIIILIVGTYAAYYMLSYKRIDDNLSLDIKGDLTTQATLNTDIKVISYNVGFGAYTPDFGFFMDGGDKGRANSKESVENCINGTIALLLEKNPDIIFLQEVDKKATRSYKVDQEKMYLDALNGYETTYAINYDSPYLIYPFNLPFGSALAGMMVASKYGITSSVRRSLPVETGFSKYFDLDRCYTVNRVNVENGKELLLYCVHLSAYTSDGKIADTQLQMLIDNMKLEYEKGNYIICGGDFNKDLLGNSSEIFGVDGSNYTWAQPIKEEYLTGTGLNLVKPFNEENPVPSCRNADGPYNKDQFVITIDGFIISNNITLKGADVIDTGFEYSDHNPVEMTVMLN